VEREEDALPRVLPGVAECNHLVVRGWGCRMEKQGGRVSHVFPNLKLATGDTLKVRIP